MNRHTHSSNWIWLYLLLPLILVLGFVDTRLVISELDHRLLEFGILILVYGLVNRWVSSNETAFIEPRNSEEKRIVRHYIIHEFHSDGEKPARETSGTGIAVDWGEPALNDHHLIGRDN